ncbi:uncharacterized protein FOMMEDRAFT_20699 [Fomitiporia mediterranea MF3/22]|uniref:uncharacterized protein n=1 Tax=Fomitiporia mediterranea (strain MF3/22) TaxID=694068 RepID=UPI0004408E0A|nr:uncharacterized protein FOMMEDRAFT_20699 [Fomitiporia mediterranea MF3/22]EJD01935.1 hypothetical protein FOMMEDRAFT_20699 [Fomitiporia mediterranea MF3/22]
MSAPNPLPSYIYKILPNTPTYQGTPQPIPSSWVFPKPQLDLTSGYVHLSPRNQLPTTLNRFFNSDADKTDQLLKVDYKKLSTWKKVNWERTSSGDVFPHLYADLEGEYVVGLKVIERENEEKGGWEGTLGKLEEEGWLED